MHRRETILAAIATALTGLATTGSRVYRDQTYTVNALPALAIVQGEDVATDAQVYPHVDRTLSVRVEAFAEHASTVATTLNQIEAEVYAALIGSSAWRPAGVEDVRMVGASEPELVEDADAPTGGIIIQFAVRYRHDEASTETFS